MAERDYFLRRIEQIGEALVRIRRRIAERDAAPEEVDEDLRETARAAGVDLDTARLATADTLALLVAPGGSVDALRCWVLAELLLLDGLEAEGTGRTDSARASYRKASRLFDLLEPEGGFYPGWPEPAERNEMLRSKLDAS